MVGNLNKTWTEIGGWYGVIAILTAYLLNSFNIIDSSNIWYFFLNLTGAIGVILDAWRQKNYQPVVLNLVWAVVAIIGLIRLFYV